eukprot:752306-Hanusia_phi.AAC.2
MQIDDATWRRRRGGEGRRGGRRREEKERRRRGEGVDWRGEARTGQETGQNIKGLGAGELERRGEERRAQEHKSENAQERRRRIEDERSTIAPVPCHLYVREQNKDSLDH